MHKGCYASLTAAPEPATIISIASLFKGFNGGVWAQDFHGKVPIPTSSASDVLQRSKIMILGTECLIPGTSSHF